MNNMKVAAILITVAVLAGCSTSPAVRDAHIKTGHSQTWNVTTIHVKGLSCPFCVLGIEKRMKAIDAVGKVTSEWDRGEIYVTVDENKSVSDDEFREAIQRAGFTPGKIERPGGKEKVSR